AFFNNPVLAANFSGREGQDQAGQFVASNSFKHHAPSDFQPGGQDQRGFSKRVAVIQGIFDPSGEKLLKFKPVFRFPWPSQPISRPRTGPFVAEIIDTAGVVTRVTFDALLSEDSGRKRGPIRGFFEIMVPISPTREIASIRITDREGRRNFGAFKRSQPPRIRIVAPTTRAKLGEKTQVVWDARDPDTPQNQLVFQVAYSPNGGRSWVPVAVDVQGREATFDSTEIQRSKGNGVIRVFVSDGTNTAFADVTNLTTLTAKYK
ncbi:MAG: hypothetical protein M3Y84_00695, partial [Acidobacteriota bacterium]|nr:hypothetical protein [Acidobacteriota bacterium]